MPIDFSLPKQFHGILSTIGLFDVLDILIVAAILYKVYEMLQDTRAITLVKGILVLLAVTMVCSWLDLHVISWLLQKAVTLLFVALPIVFQPELRSALEQTAVQIEYVAGVGLAPGRPVKQQAHGAVGDGVLGEIVVYHERVAPGVHEILRDGAGGVRR